MARGFLFILDSVGIGGAPDAQEYGDFGANTLGHIAARARDGLRLPNLERLGIGLACAHASGELPHGFDADVEIIGRYANAREQSRGKDTPSGHWELAGVTVDFDWGYFPKTVPAFPDWLTQALVEKANLPGILGNKHASGTEIIAELGGEHIRTGCPILYTSADSVLQIAAHETHFGLDRLYSLCTVARTLVDRLNIGRVIARPFTGERSDAFERTGNRRDYSIPPNKPTLLERAKLAGRNVFAVGKIDDIFAHCGPTKIMKANGNDALMEATHNAMQEAGEGDLVVTNFVDFDQLYGHRRDVDGYARALEAFDAKVPSLMAAMSEHDLMILTADHGNDPTWHGTDHTREQVPVMAWAREIEPGYAGARTSFCDVGATLSAHLGLATGECGTSLFRDPR